MLLKDIEGEAPDSNAAAMERLKDAGVLSPSVVAEMAKTAYFRTVRASEYGDGLDHETVSESLQSFE